MEKQYYDNLIVSSAPHAVSSTDTTKIMGTVLLALLPAFVVGIYPLPFASPRSGSHSNASSEIGR